MSAPGGPRTRPVLVEAELHWDLLLAMVRLRTWSEHPPQWIARVARDAWLHHAGHCEPCALQVARDERASA